MAFRVALDTETGGINPAEHSLLELALVVTDDRGTQLAEYSAEVLPQDGLYRVAPKALEINGIDLREHAKNARPLETVAAEVVEFVSDFRAQGGPLILVGYNVNFDRGFLQHQLLGFETVAKLFGYRTMDLHAVMAFLADAGKMPYTKSLEVTAEFFGLLGGEKQEHRALADTRLTAQVYREMLRFLG